MLTINLALAGITLGSIAALSGIGLLLTYRTTGVFNLAHGGIAMITAYLLWQMVRVWHIPTTLAAILAICVFAPLLGIIVERLVFRQLQRRNASPAESLVATLGLLVLLIGVAAVVWGLASKSDAPQLFPSRSIDLPGGAIIGVDTLIMLAIAVGATIGIAILTEGTHLGTEIRAVVNRREFAELAVVDADQVSSIGWAVGAAFAGLTGVLLAPVLQLNPYNLTFVVLETFAVPVIARLYSLPAAILAGLGIGVAQSELVQVHVGWLQGFVREVHVNGLVVALFIALMALNSLHEVGGGDSGAASIFATRTADDTPVRRRAAQYTIGAVLLCVPFFMSPLHLRQAEIVPALAVIFVSLVAVTGYSGQISLGQVGFAGLGALFYAKFAQGDLFGLHSLPGLVSLLGGMIVAGIVGFATGYPAIRRRGLFLALTTFAVGALVSRFVFNDPFFTSGVQVNRPSVLGWSLNGEVAFYAFELGCLVLTLLVVRNLRSGRLGRALVAVRDSEAGARSVGIDIGVLKIFIFAASSALAGLGGALLALSQRSFEPTTFDPLQGLFWFTAVVVFGADSAAGAVIAAAVVVTLDTVFVPNSSTVLIGVLALFLGRMPGGVVEGVRQLTARLVTPAGLITSWESSLTLAPPPPRRLSAAGRAALARVRR
ncbi:MAG TPA: ABC transporter permease [Mycobacteriales bacterium]|nr:ABC transporter permease [Mycobacteriales bacterium]